MQLATVSRDKTIFHFCKPQHFLSGVFIHSRKSASRLAVWAEGLRRVGRLSGEGEGVGVVHPAQLVVAAASLALLALLLLVAGVLPLLVGSLCAGLQEVQQTLLVEDGHRLCQHHQHQHAQHRDAHHVISNGYGPVTLSLKLWMLNAGGCRALSAFISSAPHVDLRGNLPTHAKCIHHGAARLLGGSCCCCSTAADLLWRRDRVEFLGFVV